MIFEKKFQKMLRDISRDRSWFTISNFLTLSRIALVPFIVIGIMYAKWFQVFLLLIIAIITDMLDGYLARKLNQFTKLGAYLDPIADKFLLFSMFAALAFVRSPSFKIPVWFVVLFFLRELTLLVGTIVMSLLKIPFEIKPSVWGKMTTFFQSTFILWIFTCYFFDWTPVRTYSITIILLALFSLFSLGQYTITGIRHLKK